MPNYSTQYNPYLDLAGAAQGPAAGLMRVLTELPQQRAQARLLGSQVDENTARIGLMGEQGRTEQAQQSMLRSQGQEYSARAGLYDSDAKKNELLMQLTDQIQKVVGQGSVDLLHGVDSPAARSVLSLNAAANTLNHTPNAMQQITQGVNLMGAKGDPIALANVQNAGRGVPFGRAVASGVTTPTILPEGASLASGTNGTNAPAISLTAPKAFSPGGTAAVSSARLHAIGQILAGGMKALESGASDPAVVAEQVKQALATFDQYAGQQVGTNAPAVGLPAGTNAPVVRRYNPATGKIE